MKLSVQEYIKGIPHYPKAAMYGFEDGWVRLSSNENPYPPSPEAISRMMDELFCVNRYPGNESELKVAISKHYGRKPENVLIGNGSNELIELSLRAMKHGTRNKVVISEPSFAFYEIASRIYGYETVKAPLVKMKVDLGVVRDCIDDHTRVVFLNNPNNPTGTIFNGEKFTDFLKNLPADVLVVIDEAYGEFVESKAFPDSFSYIDDYPIVILKTFSKAYGLAGLRIGYGVGEKSVISFLDRTKQPFSVNVMAIIAAKAALMDQKYLKKVLNNNRRGKKFLYTALKSLSVEFIPTEANYILIKIGSNAESVTKRLYEEKILVRWMGAYNLDEYIRVGIGTMDENIVFVEALKRIL